MNVQECKLMKATVCPENMTVTEVAQMMEKEGTRQVLVTKNDQLAGLISMTDIVQRVVAQKKDPLKVKAREIMTTPIESIDGATPIEKACLQMIRKNMYSTPVTKNGKIIGILPLSLSNLKQHKKP